MSNRNNIDISFVLMYAIGVQMYFGKEKGNLLFHSCAVARIVFKLKELLVSSQENKRDEVPGKEKEFSIIVNGRSHVVEDKKISYEEVLRLSDIQNSGSNSLQLITFERGEHGKAKGSLSDGDMVNIKSGMVFNVSSTNKS